ncbi:hypothetical protein Tco_1354134 [Tanacetum coccineum]
MDANKKIDLENPLCPNESKLLANILQNHPLRFSIAASSSVPWIYLGKFWHTLKEDGSKYKLSFVLDRKELTLLLMISEQYFTCLKLLTTIMIILSLLQTRDKYHNLEDDEMVKSIFNLGKNKAGVGMKILSWMITDDMKLMKNYRKYVAVFEVDVPTTLSQPIESTQGTYRTTSILRTPNPDVAEEESSASRKSTVIRLRIPQRRSTRLTPPTPIPTTNEAGDIILQDIIQLSLAEQKSHEELEAKQNKDKVKEHLMAKEIEKLAEGTENIEENDVDSSTLRQNDPDTRLEPRSNNESPEVEITADVQPVNVNEEEEESAKDDCELKRRGKGKHKLHELTVNDPPPSTPSSSSPKSNLSASQHILSLFKPNTSRFKRYKSLFDELQGRYRYLFEHLKTRFMPRKKYHELAHHLQEVMEESLPKMANTHVKELTKTQMRLNKNVRIFGHRFLCKLTMLSLTIFLLRPSIVRPRDQDDPHDDAYPEGENSLSTLGIQEQLDDFDFWIDSYATYDDDELPTEKAPTLSLVNQDLLHLKKGNSGPKKIMMSLHKFPAVIFPDDDIEERTSRWVDKCVKKFNPYYKNLNKNDIEDLYMLIVNGKVNDYARTRLPWSLSVFIRSTVIWERVHDFQLGVESYQQKVNLTALTITFLGIENYKMFSIISKLVYGIINKNNKKEKRVMRHQEVHKFCDATLKRVLEGLKNYNNNVKHGYVTPSLSKEDVEYLQLFEEEIKERLKHHYQMRCWEMYVRGRPIGSRRGCPE